MLECHSVSAAAAAAAQAAADQLRERLHQQQVDKDANTPHASPASAPTVAESLVALFNAAFNANPINLGTLIPEGGFPGDKPYQPQQADTGSAPRCHPRPGNSPTRVPPVAKLALTGLEAPKRGVAQVAQLAPRRAPARTSAETSLLAMPLRLPTNSTGGPFSTTLISKVFAVRSGIAGDIEGQSQWQGFRNPGYPVTSEAEQNLFIGNPAYAGKGDFVIVFRSPEGANFTPGQQPNEFINFGTVRVRRLTSCMQGQSILMTATVEFGNIQELETAFRSLVLFKFSGSDDADVYLGIPVMANVATRMLNSIETYWRSVGDMKRADAWRNLYRLSNAKQHANLISSYQVRHSNWVTMNRPEKLEWLQIIAAPYLADDEGIHLFDSLIYG